ncbi:hypothetical protein NDU88_002207, partial [Pleurodeles waltl]
TSCSGRWTFDRTLLLDQEVLLKLRKEADFFFSINLGSAPLSVVWDTFKAVIRGELRSCSIQKHKRLKEEIYALEQEMR